MWPVWRDFFEWLKGEPEWDTCLERENDPDDCPLTAIGLSLSMRKGDGFAKAIAKGTSHEDIFLALRKHDLDSKDNESHGGPGRNGRRNNCNGQKKRRSKGKR